jgi:hypothetical protein
MRLSSAKHTRQEVPMRVVLLVLSCTVLLSGEIRAQAAKFELQAGLGYAWVFDAGGISFAAALDRSLSPATTRLQHRLGGTLWYAHTGIASDPDDPYGRHIYGMGVRYQLALARAASFRPYLAVPLQVLHSRIPDRYTLQSANVGRHGIPDPGPPSPIEDRIGGEWGWGTGVELGFRLGIGKRVSGHTSVQALYQDIYETGSRHGAWNWHAGITYAFNGS